MGKLTLDGLLSFVDQERAKIETKAKRKQSSKVASESNVNDALAMSYARDAFGGDTDKALEACTTAAVRHLRAFESSKPLKNYVETVKAVCGEMKLAT